MDKEEAEAAVVVPLPAELSLPAPEVLDSCEGVLCMGPLQSHRTALPQEAVLVVERVVLVLSASHPLGYHCRSWEVGRSCSSKAEQTLL